MPDMAAYSPPLCQLSYRRERVMLVSLMHSSIHVCCWVGRSGVEVGGSHVLSNGPVVLQSAVPSSRIVLLLGLHLVCHGRCVQTLLHFQIIVGGAYQSSSHPCFISSATDEVCASILTDV